MLSDLQIRDLATKMAIPLVFCSFKDNLSEETLDYNKGYIINMESTVDPESGKSNEGSHYTCFFVRRYPSGEKQGIYFDSFGIAPPQEVIQFCPGIKMHHSTKDIQSICSDMCGWYCLAFLYWVSVYPGRTGHLFADAEGFTDLFDDMNTSIDHKKNEYILKHFFRSDDPAKRTPIEV